MYTSIYTEEIPVLLEQLANTTEMQRLSDIGMHCGCEYTNYPFYQMEKIRYTRFTHSVGVSKIVWNFTHDIRQAIAGLFHDIATPAFAHTIDFLQGDHLRQESTEDKTLLFIENSREISVLLKKHHIRIDDVCDYHQYPIADNGTPMLSADRLEYTFGNGYCLYNMGLEILSSLYKELTIATNEHGTEELCFQSIDAAKKFTEISLRNSHFFVSDQDRFSMQYLADLIRLAIENGVLLQDDLYETESKVIKKLNNNKQLSELWKNYTELTAVAVSAEKPENKYSVNISAKKRYIDPLVLCDNKTKRLTEIDLGVLDQIQTFLNIDFNQWIFAV
ncbi:HD domain-containing protein [Anaerocolumna sedimenticola]|uniref:HD domain-containing protein n=1 Tax=Anaerocolumna sedimenticola TaxID=2696063 RepID=A0A6P1TJH8_9FIRM|nr:HD domain-containing protein [Anaerocolumna sedimenticola]QHQ59795.1 HD domain-containing protein [Anaerocolumna sedimenticola]